MPATTSPFFGINYGWTTGESGWGDPVNSNFKVLSFLGKGAVDSFVAALPGSPNEGDSVVLTTDNKFYVRIGAAWLFIVPQKGQEVNETSTGKRWQYGVSWVEIPSVNSLSSRVGILEQFDTDLANSSNASKGAALVGYRGRNVYAKLEDAVSAKDFGVLTDGTDTTVQLQAALDSGKPLIFQRDWVLGVSAPLTHSVGESIINFNKATILQLGPMAGPVLTISGDFAGVENLRMGGVLGGTNGIKTTGFRNYLRGCNLSGAYTGEVLYVDGLETHVEFCKFKGGERGVWVNKADSFFMNVYCEQNRQEGFRAITGTVTALHVHSFGNTGRGFYLVGCAFSEFLHCYADTNGEHGWYIFDSSGSNFDGCWGFKSGQNNIATPATYYEWVELGTSANKYNKCFASHGGAAIQTSKSYAMNSGSYLTQCSSDHDPVTAVSGSKVGTPKFMMCTGNLAPFNTNPGEWRSKDTVPISSSVNFSANLGRDILGGLGTDNTALFKITLLGRKSVAPSPAVLTEFYVQVANNTTGTAAVKTHVLGTDIYTVSAVTATTSGISFTVASSDATTSVITSPVVKFITDARAVV